jgi:hypothetical protein
MSSTSEPPPGAGYVFGYGSLVAMNEPILLGGRLYSPAPGRLHGFRRRWGAAMNNWEATELEKHFVDPETGEKPGIRVAYLDIEESERSTVNGLAIPVDAARLADFDLREINYLRIDVSSAFEPSLSGPVYAYRGTDAARERCLAQPGLEVYVSRDYLAAIRRAFATLGEEALEEYDRTTEPLSFPERHLELRYPPPFTDSTP